MAAYVTVSVVLGYIACTPSAVIEDRRSLRAKLLVPGDLRLFPVERHIEQGESFVYTMSTVRDHLTRWRLSIDSIPQRQDCWKHALAGHIAACGFQSLGRPRNVGNSLHMRFGASGGRYATLKSQKAEANGRICLTLEYWPNLSRTRPSCARPMDLARFYYHKIRRALFGKNAPIITITGPS
jgi:hypothetical protein